MNFLRKILGNTEKEVDNTTQKKQTIFELFKIDIQDLPNDAFYLSNMEKDSEGIIKLFFKHKLDYKECGLFSNVDVILHSEESYNVTFESDINFDFHKLEELINDIYSIYGKDDEKHGRLTKSEIKEINNHYWSGRNYFEDGKYKNKPSICLNELEGSINLTVFNPKMIPLKSDESVLSAKYKPKGISLLEKLKQIDIDFYNYDRKGTTLEFTVEEEINGITNKLFKSLDNHFFTSSIFMNYENGNKELFFIKNEVAEKDYKTLIDQTGELFAQDLTGRALFTMDDLNIIRGIANENDEAYRIRHWIDLHSEYNIVITFEQEEKQLYLRIYKS